MRHVITVTAAMAVVFGTLCAGPVAAQGRQGVVGGVNAPDAAPPRPAPRRENGRVRLDGGLEPGIWLSNPGKGFWDLGANAQSVPYQPWAAAVAEDRRQNQLEPHARCKPSGLSRQFLTPYGVEIVELPDIQRIYIFDIGGPHTYRTIYLDGRTHPENLSPSFYGHSIGWWEGDTLVVETTGFNEAFWMDRGGLPHTDQLRTVERFTRTDFGTVDYVLTIDDPGAYTAPFDTRMGLRWAADDELFEYICQQANYAGDLMVGQGVEADRTSLVIP